MSINNKFQNYVQKNLSPTEEERKFISQEWKRVQSFLKGDNFQSGSYARFTSITPVNDLDVIWVLPEDFMVEIFNEKLAQKLTAIDPDKDLRVNNIIKDLARELEKKYKEEKISVEIKAQTHSVGIYFLEKDNFSIDIVPAIPINEENNFEDYFFLVPEVLLKSHKARAKFYKGVGEGKIAGKIRWIKSDPKGYKKNAKELNDKNTDFRKAVKFPKRWKFNCKEQDDNFPLKSFHIEAIITSYFEENPNITCFEAVDKFFQELPKFLEKPYFPDRANKEQFTDEYINEISETDKKLVLDKQKRALKIIEKIKNAGFSDKEISELLEEETKMSIPSSVSRVKPTSQPYATNHKDIDQLAGIIISQNDEDFLKKNFQI